jgi:glycosyltransferase involved in cell wall biosynthesis
LTISIIIPIYNRSKIVLSTIQSIINQTYENFECIIVDDNSTDNLFEQFISWNLDSRFRLINNSRSKGAQGARNTGFLESNGDYVCFFDSDNLMQPEFLSKMYNMLIINNNSAVTCFSNLIRDKKRVGGMEFTNEGDILRDLLENKTYVDFNSLMFNRNHVINNIGLLDESCVSHQELDFSIRLALSTKFSYVNEYLVDYRLDGVDRISSSYERGIIGLIYIYIKYNSLISITQIGKIRLWILVISKYNKNCLGNIKLKNQIKNSLVKVNLRYLIWIIK